FKPFNPDDFFGQLLILEREWTSPAGAFPSFHVAWTFFAAFFYTKTFPNWRKLFYFVAIIISISCITTGMHSLSDVAAGWVLFCFSVNYSFIWEYLKRLSEKIANSYQEYYLGKMRIINHAIFPGIAGFVGIFITSALTNQPTAVFVICICSIIVAGLWAQIIEGSAKLSRPFGFFGGVIGGLLGILLVSKIFSLDLWLLFGAFTVAAPWVQGSGRFRCWVQGCCHGKLTSSEIGICYHHPRSRVLVISQLGNLPLHNTQLYSVLSCFIIGFILSSLWFREASMPMIVGLYLILTGLSRFVEEHYRGEPQTPIYYGLRLYQWLAIAFVTAGIIFTTIKYEVVKPTFDSFYLTLLFALSFGFIAAFLMGIDFPFSNRRFSRLASAD
ncbi:MAG: prolipoprotein diacylglyceryl transferase family protein, partial [Acidobacteriota bacterium]